MPNPYEPHTEDQTQRAEWTREFGDLALARPDFVGWHICGTIDTPKSMSGKNAKQHSGLMNTTGEYYPEMADAVQQLSAGMYRIAIDS